MNRKSAGKTLEIINLRLQNKSIIEIAQELNIPYGTVSRHLRKEKMASNRKKSVFINTLNVDYFKTIDTEDKAYFLGLIKADGYIDQKRERMALRLQEKDEIILIRFCEVLNIPKERINKVSKKEHQPSYNKNASVCSELTINNKDFVRNILDVKFNTILTKVPAALKPHFIRGYFDGDGCISYRDIKRIKFQLNIMGNPNDDHMLRYIQEAIPFHIYNDKRSNLPYIQSSSIEHIDMFRLFAYTDCYIYLPRKKEKFDLFKFAKETSTTTRETPYKREVI